MLAEHQKPSFNNFQASEIVKKHYNLTANEISSLPSYDDQNFFVATTEGHKYILKIMNSKDSKNPSLIEVQTYAMSFLHKNGLPTQNVILTTTGQLMAEEEMDIGRGPEKFVVRLLTFLPGITISKAPLVSQKLLYEIGRMAARMDNTLQQMDHPQISELQREEFIWSLSNVPLLEPYIPILDGNPLQKVVISVIQQYKTSVVPKYSSFRKCINHGDFNEQNVLVQPDENNGYRISGILDFGDMNQGYYIHELAITIMYMMIGHPDPIEIGGPVIAGWESIIPLNEAEKDCLYLLVLSRFCQSIVCAYHSVTVYPSNAEYLLSAAKKGSPAFLKLWEVGREHAEKIWFQGAAEFNYP